MFSCPPIAHFHAQMSFSQHKSEILFPGLKPSNGCLNTLPYPAKPYRNWSLPRFPSRHLTTILPLINCSSTPLTLQHRQACLHSGLLLLVFSLPVMFFPQITAWVDPFHHSGLSANATSSETPTRPPYLNWTPLPNSLYNAFFVKS